MPHGQHEAGKHSKAGKRRAAESPRLPKNPNGKATNPTTTTGTGRVYESKHAKDGVIRKLFGKG